MLSVDKIHASFPTTRLRRNRRYEWLRRLVAESHLSVNDLIQPIFLCDDPRYTEIPSMPGIYRLGGQRLIDYVGEIDQLKIPAIALFPYYPKEERQENVVSMLHRENFLCRSIENLKKHFPGIGLITDVALDCYTIHGQDGLVADHEILNDETNALIAQYAVTQAQAGADMIAPSEMMDGRVGVIRHALDRAGFEKVGILSYAAKYASHFYGPFRDAVGSKTCLGQADKKTYQMDPANANEALREVALDLQEGADSVMVKPGLPYLDIVRMVKEAFKVPTFVYQVSGEYAMLKAASEKGWLDYEGCMLESLIAFKRAGADGILSYASAHTAEILKRG